MGNIRTSLRPLRHVLKLAPIILIASCATTRHRTGDSGVQTPAPALSPSTALASDSPMAASAVIQSADLGLKAARQGFRTEIRDGELFYCSTDTSLGTRIPTTKCLSEPQFKMWLQQEEQQRQQMQRSLAGPACPTGIQCH